MSSEAFGRYVAQIWNDLREEASREGFEDALTNRLRRDVQQRQRAAAVRDHLIAAGVPAEKITAVGRGSVEPVTTCEGERGQALIDCLAPNRRVEVKVVAP